MTRTRYDVYLNTPAFPGVPIADLIIAESDGALLGVGVEYRANYLAAPGAFALDPAQLPLPGPRFELNCRLGSPALLDDYLPDAWGRRVLVSLARARQRQDFDANSVVDRLSLRPGSGTTHPTRHGH